MKNDLKHNAGKNLLAQSSELSGIAKEAIKMKQNSDCHVK